MQAGTGEKLNKVPISQKKITLVPFSNVFSTFELNAEAFKVAVRLMLIEFSSRFG